MVRAPAMTFQALRDAIDQVPRVALAATPTPIQEASNLTKALGGPRILVKRDDLTGLGFGGNKVRHMEFCMADAIAKGADVSINSNLWVSNNSRVIGAASKKMGMHYICVVAGGKGKPIQGNLLLLDLMGTELHLLESTDDMVVSNYVRELAQKVRGQGHIPYVHPFELMSRASGAVGYIDNTLEMASQLNELAIHEVKIYLVTGASHGGLALGAKALGLPWDIMGVLVADPSLYYADVIGWGNGAAQYLKLPLTLEQKDVTQTSDYIGPGYAMLSQESTEAIRMMAELEGIILEPIYTARALAAIIDHTRKGILTSKDTVLFMHTGGLPELFNFSDGLKRIHQ
ncbi:pyridoxal-phosphate dependent enzyme [Dehalococcoidia bacterium]|nr:pyridoxal-phosphate dependent enzyme [Dehalococcoidia bacterium]